MRKFTASELREFETLLTKGDSELKIDTGDCQVWLNKKDQVTVELLVGRVWRAVEFYSGNKNFDGELNQ
jgi:hypothetical protein